MFDRQDRPRRAPPRRVLTTAGAGLGALAAGFLLAGCGGAGTGTRAPARPDPTAAPAVDPRLVVRGHDQSSVYWKDKDKVSIPTHPPAARQRHNAVKVPLMSLMRYTIVQDDGGISFVGDEYMLPALVAACATNPTTYQSLLDVTHEYDRRPRDEVRNALAIFDEHNVPGCYDAIHHALAQEHDVYRAAFRIVDDKTRHASVQPAPAGVIIFNLKERRIVQMQSDAGEVGRTGQAQHHTGRGWTRRVQTSALPDTWRIVP